MAAISASFTSSGALSSLTAGDLSLLQYPATECEAGPAQLWLRVRDGDSITPHPLTGPASGSAVSDGVVSGHFGGLSYRAWFMIEGETFGWLWQCENTGDEAVTADVVFLLDPALTGWDDLRRNEYYVSQYLDVSPMLTTLGTALGVRQNMPGTTHPWLGVAGLTGTQAWCTDALQLHQPTGGLDLATDLPASRLQHEHTLVGLQTPPETIEPGRSARGGFVGLFVDDHPRATDAADAQALERVAGLELWKADAPQIGEGSTATATIFGPAVIFESDAPRLEDVTQDGELTAIETGPDNVFWSANLGMKHLVGRDKERTVLRPHGHIMSLSPTAIADERSTASTVWMNGVFASQLTHGHASNQPSLTLRRGYLDLMRSGGVHAAAHLDGQWQLLGQPTLWTQDLHESTWLYRKGELEIRVTATLTTAATQLALHANADVEVLLAVEVGEGPVGFSHELDDDAILFADNQSRGTAWRCLTGERDLRLTISVPEAGETTDAHSWRLPDIAAANPNADIESLSEAIGWLAHDAQVHFQTPRGLEQYTGGAWGVRDVCQGPVGLLVSAGEHAAIRDTLLSVFAGQHDNGDWPQWFDYLDSSAQPGHRESHGDVVYWPLMALGEYLAITGDDSILDEPVRFVGESAFEQPHPVREHLRRAIEHISTQRTFNGRLPAYGHGDWNDSLQPARPELAEIMFSTWTSELEIESLTTLSHGLGNAEPELRQRLDDLVMTTEKALDEILTRDGELAGYAVVGSPSAGDSGVQLLVHPSDAITGLRHGSLQVIHALIGELLTPESAAKHVEIIDQHLSGPTGIYLFDAPVRYAGGEMRLFKRAEAASFWGREIGLMYTHAHVRWVEALTHLGDAERAWQELLKVIPSAVVRNVSGALPRQSSCYYSSSDATFADRYEATARAADLHDPHTGFEGGWRVYSSGPGLLLRIITERIFGVRFRSNQIDIDPVLAQDFDGSTVQIPTPDGGHASFTLHCGRTGHGVTRVSIEGSDVELTTLDARYRAGGAAVAKGSITAGSVVEVWTD